MKARKHPRTIADVKADPRVSSIHQEYNGPRPSWWVYLKPGLICLEMDCGTIHEDTIADVCSMLREVVTESQYKDLKSARAQEILEDRVRKSAEEVTR